MDSQTGNPPSKKGGLMPLSEHPKMDRLAEILENLPPERQQAFEDWLETTATEKSHDEQESTD